MMSSWKQKLKDFSGARNKSPVANHKDDSQSIASSHSNHLQAENHEVPLSSSRSSFESSNLSNDKTPSLLSTPQFSTSSSDGFTKEEGGGKFEEKSQVNKEEDEEDDPARRPTITPDITSNFSNLQLSSEDIDSNKEPKKLFHPGLLTVKIYHGSDFKVPFDINHDRNLLVKLINTSSDPQTREALTRRINQLSSIDTNSEQFLTKNNRNVINKYDIGSLIPANVTIPPSIIKNSLIYFSLEFDKTIVTLDADAGSIYQPIFNKISQFDVTKVNNELKFQVYLRLPTILTSISIDEIDTNQDVLISSKTISLDFSNINNPVRIKNHDILKFENDYLGFNHSINGELTLTIDFKPNRNKQLNINDFDLLKVIGKGSFGKVMQVRKKDSGKIYALKAIRKAHIVSRSEVVHTLAERTVLAKVDNPFIVPLKFSFQSPEKLYLVLSFINGGELFYHLQREGKFELQRSRLYAAELLSALECLHSLDVIYRDLKPENILLDYKGHIALCDFGLCKLNMKNEEKTKTFCGTPEYLAPELLLGNGYTKTVDWWTLGVLLYEMLTGLPPYYDENVTNMYQKILKDPLRFPNGFDADAKDILIYLLARDPKIRLGNNGAYEIKQHAFFKGIDWRRLNNKGYQPPFKPKVKDGFDTSNFDREFTNEQPVDSVINDYLSESVQKQFGGWTYVGTENLGDSLSKN
ncbi:hypothetical protein WICMUC_003899 [Wickerhamomyces mucosus]|uniref:non-specific serine/threonine protein kinase n=1 Tax=Wickerhamomyces mucosus TaxID=1378264 RepID=A0A9P8TBJ2_9ASCO|nr:hypothetical protein WICMUC_003899 [Wickerhamomyces mucosus]